MKKMIVILAMAGLVSCKNEYSSLIGENVDKVAILTVTNSKGNDLLNPSLDVSYKENGINIYHVVSGGVQKVQRTVVVVPGATPPSTFETRGFEIVRYANQDLYTMKVDLNISGLNDNSDGYTITYVEWSNLDTDTLKVLFHKYDNKGIWYSELWYNGVELRKNAVEAFNLNENPNKILHYSIVK